MFVANDSFSACSYISQACRHNMPVEGSACAEACMNAVQQGESTTTGNRQRLLSDTCCEARHAKSDQQLLPVHSTLLP